MNAFSMHNSVDSNVQDVRIAIRINRSNHVQRIMTEEGSKPEASETKAFERKSVGP